MSHRALQHVCMCGSKWWWGLSFLRDGKKTKSAPTPSPCCLLCNLVSLMSQTHAPSQWLVMGDLKELHAVCAKWLHDHGNMSCIQPRVLLVWPSATSPQILKNRKKNEKKQQLQNNLVLILGCREGWVGARLGIGIYTGFYCHSILKLHFWHRKTL